MIKCKGILSVVLFFFFAIAIGQTARIKGVILDENKLAVEGVTVVSDSIGTVSNANGYYSLSIPANKLTPVVFSFLGYKDVKLTLALSPNEDYEFNPQLSVSELQIGEVVVTANRREVVGLVSVSPKTLRTLPGANAGVENILKTLPGVYSNSDLSSQYAVRGGNYDENLVYVNEIEVYRPFLIRSGQQEGLSFTNSDLTKDVHFSAGGFQAKYGDKMSSVLDITYKTPSQFAASIDASLLGVNSAIELASKNNKWSAITGIRYRDNSLLVNSKDETSNYKPSFTDVQTYITYRSSLKWQWHFMGNISDNIYNIEPISRTAQFGTVEEPNTLYIAYDGQERDRFTTNFGALKTNFKPNENTEYRFITSLYHTQEIESFDIIANYKLEEETNTIGNENIGDVTFTNGIGSQLSHARNNLDALIFNGELKGTHKLKKGVIDWGIKYTKQDIRDRIVEWEVIDSAGFVINPYIPQLPNQQPYIPYNGQLSSINYVNAKNFVTIDRASGYLQYTHEWDKNGNIVSINSGLRVHQWQVTDKGVSVGQSKIVYSPRGQLSYKPNWKKDIVWRLSGGLYQQPPFYRDLRRVDGTINTNVDAQQAVHSVLSMDYSFKMWDRPFKWVAETYYKSLTDVNTYTIDNVRIRYRANNNAVAYVGGIDFRINGEFVPGTESWFSLGLMKTQENQDNRGYIDRPTDQRVNVGVLFQDYVPRFPNAKMYMNMVYNTGLPGGAPVNTDAYDYQNRLPAYRRVDIGFAYILLDGSKFKKEKGLKYQFRELSIGAELFNIFNIRNSNTNIWVRDVTSKNQFSIPNYMTARVLNFRLQLKL